MCVDVDELSFFFYSIVRSFNVIQNGIDINEFVLMNKRKWRYESKVKRLTMVKMAEGFLNENSSQNTWWNFVHRSTEEFFDEFKGEIEFLALRKISALLNSSDRRKTN